MAQLNFGTGDYVDFGTTESSTAASVVLDGTLITNAVVGDLIVVLVHDQAASATATSGPTATGWVRVGAANGSPDTTTSRQTGIYYYAIDSSTKLASFQASHTWTFASAGRVSCIATRATGIDLAAPTAGAATAFTGATSAATLTIGAITTTTSPALVVAGVHRQSSAGANPTLSSIAGMTIHERRTSVSTAISTTGTALGYLQQTSAGTTGTVLATWGAAAAQLGGELVAFKVGSWSPPAPTGIAVKYTSATDTLATGHLFHTSAADTLAAPVEVRKFPTGYASVTAMLAGGSTSTPFYCAHRGGSDNWPEMSLYAYTQAGYWGVGALEASLARTSDGVWFGLHDGTLDRTSGVTGVDASTLTWAAIQASYSVSASLPSGQTAKPYMRLEELVAAYGSTHVLFIDPKAAVANLTELMSLLSSLYGGNTNLATRVVIKYYGVSGMTIPDAAAARGVKTWGYFYGSDSANYTTYAGRWDILGMDYQGTAQNWIDLAAAAPTTPIMGHICPSAATVATCTSRGAIGAMVSGVTSAITRAP